MMATVPHVTSGLGLRKFQADGFCLQECTKRKVQHINLSTFRNTKYMVSSSLFDTS